MKNFFDYDDGDMAFSISDNMAMDSDGDLLTDFLYILYIFLKKTNEIQ